MSEAQTGTVTAHHEKARTQQEAADADLTRRPLEDGHHAAQPHDDHAVDGDDQRPSRLPLAPWRPPTLSHRDLPFGTVSWRGPRLEGTTAPRGGTAFGGNRCTAKKCPIVSA